MKKIGFVTDTNMLKLKKESLGRESNIFKGIDFYLEYLNDLSKTRTKKELIYYMPIYILDEMVTQKKEVQSIEYKKMCDCYNNISYGLIGELPANNIDEVLKSQKEEYEKKLKIIELDYNSLIFKELIDDAFEKRIPFDKTLDGKKTDAGFKDAVIWKTILYSNEIDECEEFYYFTNDNVFKNNKTELIKQFNKFHPTTLINIESVDSDGSQWQKSLQVIIDKHKLIETEKIKLYNEDLIIGTIRKILYDYNEEVSYITAENCYYLKEIYFNKFETEDFDICDVIEHDNKLYEVEMSFETYKYDLKDIQLENKKKVKGEITLFFRKESEEFILNNYEIKNIEFVTDYFSYIVNGISKTVKDLYGDGLKKTMESISILTANNFNFSKDLEKTLSELSKKSIELNTEYIKNSKFINK